nr:reverse transcriptase domain-containing protein [Tanacetum cinerariifolium]
MNTASSSGSGSLPKNTVLNPQEDLKAITTRSGVTLGGPSVSPPPPSKEVDREPKTITDQVLTRSTNNVPPPFVQPSPVSTSSTAFSSPKMLKVTKDTVQTSTENIQPPVAQTQVPIDEPVVAPNSKPTIPYPSRANKQKLHEKDDNLALKFVEIFRNLHFELSFANALLHMPKFALMFKSLLNNKEKLFDLATTPVNENCSAVIVKKFPEKLGDPGKFLIPCDFPEFDECLALADLGASISLMPLSIWRKLSLPELTSTEELTLCVNDEEITFKVGQTSKYSYNDAESINRIDFIDVACEEYVQEVLGFFDKSKSGNPTLISDPIIALFSPSFTPFEGGDFILEEIKACLTSKSILLRINDTNLDLEGDIRLLEELLNSDSSSSPLPPKELNVEEIKTAKSSIDEPPKLKLKELPKIIDGNVIYAGYGELGWVLMGVKVYNGVDRNGPVSVSIDTNEMIKFLPPKTAEEVIARERERKATTTLLMALPEDHLAKFHKMANEKEIDGFKMARGNDFYEDKEISQEDRRRDVGYNRNKTRDNGRRPAYQDDSKALVTIDGEDIDWSRHVEEDAQNYAMMAYSSSNSRSDNEESDLEDTPVNDRYVDGMHAVSPPMTGNYMPSGPDVEIDYSKFTYGPNQTSADESDSKPSEYASCESDSSVETSTSMPEAVENTSKVVCEPKVWTDAPIIEDNGRITGKGKIKTGRFDFEDVYYVEELKHYNLFFVSQMCDKKNKVLFTNNDCLMLSLDFKLPDENQKGKQHKASCKAKTVSSVNQPLQILHMDLFGPTSVRSINHKTSDNGTEFKNKELIEFCGLKGIKREYENQANKSVGPKEANNSVGTHANDDQGANSEEIDLNEEHFVLPICTNLINSASTPLSTAGPSRALNDGELSYPKPSKQEEWIDYDEVFSPVARIEAIRIFLAFAYYMGFIVYQMDVKSALLYGIIDEEVYVSQPLGFVDPKFPNKVYKVVKALYGLHQAPRACPSEGIFTDSSYDDEGVVDDMLEELLQFQIQKVWILIDFPFGIKAIGTKWVYRNKKDKRGVVIRNKARLVPRDIGKRNG